MATTDTLAAGGERAPAPASLAGPSTTMLKRMGGPSDLKAGLKRDPEEVQKIIYEASKGSKYFQDQERKNKFVDDKGSKLKARLQEERVSATGTEDETADRIIEQLEEKRDLSRVIALIDADAFYASVHELVDERLKTIPFGVGGGILTTCNYIARRYGCRSAMPFFIAKKLCPDLICVKMDPQLYVKASKQMMEIYSTYGPISPASLDEAYVDLTDYCAKHGVTPSVAINRLRQEVFDKTGLTVSAGVSPNKALSKICADVNKPNGAFVIDPTREACMEFMKGIRLRRCFGLGRVTETLLNSIGFETVGDLYTRRADLYLVRNHLGQKATFRWLLSLYLGLGSNRVVRAKRGDRKTYGVEKTFRNTDKREELDEILRKIAKSLAKDLAHAEFAGRTITLKIKHANYETVTRAKTPGGNVWIKSFKDIYHHGLNLLHKEMKDRQDAITRGDKVKGGKNFVLNARLLGLRVSNLRDDRIEKKANKLDSFVQRSESKNGKGKAKEEDLSDTDDSEMERDAWDDLESGDDGQDADSTMRSQLEKLTRDALADPEDQGLIDLAEREDAEPERPFPSARWQCPDEEWIINEGLEAPTPGQKSVDDVSARGGGGGGGRSTEEMIIDDSDDADEDGGTVRRNMPRVRSDPPAPSTSRLASGANSKRKANSIEPRPLPSSTSTSSKKRKSPTPVAAEARECFVCHRELLGSEVAFNSHVNACLDKMSRQEKKLDKRQRKKTGRRPSSPKPETWFNSTKLSKDQVKSESKPRSK